MTKTISIFILLFFGTINCFSQDDTEPKLEKPIEVSLENLIQHSKRFEKKNVLVQGYAKFEKGKICRVFISKEDLEKNNLENSVCFMFLMEGSTYGTIQKCNGEYIILSGVYLPGKALESVELKNGILTSVSIKSCDDSK
ncbi:hypothetical protein IVB69_06545 [Flavobacterium sp. J49]|uniref:hypothetical protein n=1 Tax=Flavobacterium sp. J49 TaxID=2718534 RepID=UPI0015936534|nr:hypothetical protein [Flavobacterium sp. J49]MBF6641132.1 hypothetical protein [Flavobacterium sp. J49]NIC02379.1 hypothetical protein [Flavobacterium sp. J49]